MVLLCGDHRPGAHMLLRGRRRPLAQGRKGEAGRREKGRKEIAILEKEAEEIAPLRRAERPRKNTGLRNFFVKAVDKLQKICYIN